VTLCVAFSKLSEHTADRRSARSGDGADIAEDRSSVVARTNALAAMASGGAERAVVGRDPGILCGCSLDFWPPYAARAEPRHDGAIGTQ
jgi:hypothetical protein